MDALTSGEAERMARLNEEYKKRFGFPFVICAQMNDKANILLQLSERCQNERAVERARGIEEVKKICRLRLQSLLLTDGANKLWSAGGWVLRQFASKPRHSGSRAVVYFNSECIHKISINKTCGSLILINNLHNTA